MARITIIFGVLLILLAAWGYIATGSEHPTSLIPAGFGVLFIFFGTLARSPDAKKRMLWMHISVTVALILFLSLIKADIQMFHLAAQPHPIAVEEKSAASVLSLAYVLLCVRSFIEARRARLV